MYKYFFVIEINCKTNQGRFITLKKVAQFVIFDIILLFLKRLTNFGIFRYFFRVFWIQSFVVETKISITRYLLML